MSNTFRREVTRPGRIRRLVVAGSVSAGLAVACGGGGRSESPTAGVAASAVRATAFVGARLIDGTGDAPIENAILLVRDGRVEAAGPASAVSVPEGFARVDVAGKTIMPGLINAHGHVNDVVGLKSAPEQYTTANIERQLGLYARYGVTTVFSLGGDGPEGFAVRDAQDVPTLATARLFVAGQIVTANEVQAARQMVDKVADTKPDLIKIRVDDNLGTTPKMDQTVWEAVIEESHSRGLRVAAHLYYLEDARALLVKDVDFIAHSIRNSLVEDDMTRFFKAKDVCLSPTLTREVSTYVYESTPAFFSDPFFLREADPDVLKQLQDPKRQAALKTDKAAQTYKAQLPVAMKNLKRLSDAGVRIAFGTDTGPAGRFQGYFEHMELELMVKAGLTPMRVIVAATSDAARCMHVADRLGTLAPGMEADFLVLARNPLDDITNSKSLESVWIHGNRVEAKPGI
ncbi:MAG: amidohydrolase family protein [Vicinamibacterales bacterium]